MPRPEWGRYFQEAGVPGVMVLKQAGDHPALVSDPERAKQGFLPASTFKVLNACVAQQTGVAAPDTVLPWDGVKRSVAAWNADLTLAQAFRASSVPAFQQVARSVGRERMAWYVRACGYGNADIGGAIDSFWLEGDLRISALEQVDFLERLRGGGMPFDPAVVRNVEEMMLTEQGPGWALYAKTGWAGRAGNNVGWWVGWLVRDGRTWYFALNIDMTMEQAGARQGVAKAVLRAEGLLP